MERERNTILAYLKRVILISPKRQLVLEIKDIKGFKKIINPVIYLIKNLKKRLSPEQKKHNRNLASVRIVIEHVYRCLKIFRIISERYRNRRKRFFLRFNLIAGIYNYELLKSRN